MEPDNDVRSSTSPSVAVLEKLESFFAVGVSPDDLDWWVSHPYEATPGGRDSPWRRVPELQRQLFSERARSDHEQILAGELQSLQKSLGRFQEAMTDALRVEDPAAASPDIASADQTAPPSPEQPVTTTTENLGRTPRPERRVLLITAGCVGIISVVALVSQLIPHEEVGLQVFDRVQTAADNTNYSRGGGSSPFVISESTRLLGEGYGYSFFGARTTDGGVCLIYEERGGNGNVDCVDESEFMDRGLTLGFSDYVMAADRPPGFEDGDYIHVEWANQRPLTINSSHTAPLNP